MSSTDTRPNVVKLCHEDQRCADDDATLLDQYWHRFDGWQDNKSLYWNLSRVTPPESITRARRKAHELGLIHYTDDADKARQERFVEERNDNSAYSPAISWLHDD